MLLGLFLLYGFMSCYIQDCLFLDTDVSLLILSWICDFFRLEDKEVLSGHCYFTVSCDCAGFLPLQNSTANLAADFSAIKELDSLSNEIVELQRWVMMAMLLNLNVKHLASEFRANTSVL